VGDCCIIISMRNMDFKQWSVIITVALIAGMLAGWGTVCFLSQGAPETVFNKTQNVTLNEDSAIIETVDKILPSVVSIVSSENVRNIFGRIFEQKGAGTGFVISQDGLIATNKHVVESDKADYQVFTYNGDSFDAEVVAKDPLADLAILRISAKDLPVVELGNSDDVVLGQRVIAIGNALGEYQNSVTTGIISGIGRTITAIDQTGQQERLENVIQTDAAINPGNSGGPLVDLAGRVIGINTAIDSHGRLVGFAIPINSVQSAIGSVLKNGEIIRPRLGVHYIPITKEFAALNNMDITQGALVARGAVETELAVQPGGPADLAGIKEGDIIISVGNEEITEAKSLVAVLQKFKSGDSVQVKFIREGRERQVTVKLGKL